MTLVTRQAMADDGGDFISGTTVNKAFVDQVYDQIDDQAHSTTNPTIKPKAITDEVVSARGSKASLDARLDVVLNEDGTLKTQASLVTASQVQSALGSRNVAINGDLDLWSGGASAAPDNFTLAGAGATIVRTGIGEADTFHFGTGSGYAAKITRAGTDWTLTQNVIAAADFAKYVNVKGQKVSVAVKGKTALASLLRVVIDDGVTTTASSYHTGGGSEEHLSATHTISNSATKLSVYVEGTGSNGDAYVGGIVVVFADLAPSDWSPLSAFQDASATVRGLVNTGTQTFAGAKTFNAAVTFGTLPLGVFGYSRLAGDFTKNNSTVFGDVGALNFAVVANAEYYFRFFLKAKSAVAAGIKFQLTGPAAPTGVVIGTYGANGTGTSGSAVVAFSSPVTLATNAPEEAIVVEGYLRNGANAGTVQLQCAQVVADVSDTIVRAESFVMYMRRA